MDLKRHVTELKLLRRGLLHFADLDTGKKIPVELTEFQVGIVAYALSYVSMAEQLGQFEDFCRMLNHIGGASRAISDSLRASDPDEDWDAKLDEADAWLNRLLNAEQN